MHFMRAWFKFWPLKKRGSKEVLNSKEVSYLPWQNKYPNLKTTYHIKSKFFLCTKHLENLLLAKYHISLVAALTSEKSSTNLNVHI